MLGLWISKATSTSANKLGSTENSLTDHLTPLEAYGLIFLLSLPMTPLLLIDYYAGV